MGPFPSCPRCGYGPIRPRGPLLTVDVIIRIGAPDRIVLVQRKNPPPGWALPGGFVDLGESVEEAARREALEETGLEVRLLGLLGVYSDPGRDERFHTASCVFVGDAEGAPQGGDDAAKAAVFPLSALPSRIAFDHERILQDYRRRWLGA